MDRKKLEDLLGGHKTTKSRTMIKEVKRDVDMFRQDCKVKNSEKVQHLKILYSERIEKEKLVELPKHLSRYAGVKVFTEGCDLICEELKGPVVVEREGFPIPLSKVRRIY